VRIAPLLAAVLALVAFGSSAYAAPVGPEAEAKQKEDEAISHMQRPILTKSEAHMEAVIGAQWVQVATGAASYAVEPVFRCKRISRYAVSCTYTETYSPEEESNYTLEGVLRVRTHQEPPWSLYYVLIKLHRVRG